MSQETIVAKALKCIDEIYPSENTLNEGYFPTDAFIDEAVRWVIDIVPAHELTLRKNLELTGISVSNDGIGSGRTPDDYGRLVHFNAHDWKRPVFGAITEDDPRYIQQHNKVLRGNPSRPIVVETFMRGNTSSRTIRWYTTNADENDYDGQYVPYSIDFIPASLYDITAWKLAEIVLMSMHDTEGASICTSKVNEHLGILAL